MKFNKLFQRKTLLKISISVGLLLVAFLIVSYYLQNHLTGIYAKQNSLIIKDRNGEIILMQQNEKGYWAEYIDEIPVRFKELLIKKEDRYFAYHPGFNPWSMLQAAAGRLGFGKRKASSTITQQLVKILLEKEFERNVRNKIIESFYALSLEIFKSKEDILKMYANSVYFGSQAQGIKEASRLYFNLSPEMLTDGQILQLLSTISNPASNNPTRQKNKEVALFLSKRLGLDNRELILEQSKQTEKIKENVRGYSHSSNSYFELRDLLGDFSESCEVTLDKNLTEKIRGIVERITEDFRTKNVRQAAVVVIKVPENELLALVGSPNPQSTEEGYKINMIEEPRPIGSTIKPFVYLKAFEQGLRPYTQVEDREYKYITAVGFPLYPKNFDYQYYGQVTLHYALSNSLNVPSVKVLEYVGLEKFYNFLENDLGFEPIQDLSNYQLGIALGALEMNLLDLAHYFTIFANNGSLKDLIIYNGKENNSWQNISEAQYIQLINKILNDRKTSIDQFGLKSELNLFQDNYALKTGTSRDFRDSWLIGYTPDFLVGVWMGNADNSPMDEVSGQTGAGKIWAQTMEVLFNSEYNRETPFDFSLIKEFNPGNIEYGLAGDNYEKVKNALEEIDSSLILSPHDGDFFLLEENTKIILKAKENVSWFVNKEFLGKNTNQIFAPQKPGNYQIEAVNDNGLEETIIIWVQGNY